MALHVGSSTVDFCDICHAQTGIISASDNAHCKSEHVPPEELFPGGEGSVTLNKHLQVYFIVTKLFKLPATRFLRLFVPESSSGDDTKLLYSVICGDCEKIVKEAMDLYWMLVDMQKRIDKLGERLSEMKVVGEQLRREDDKKRRKEKAESLLINACTRGKKEGEMMNFSLACLGEIKKESKKQSSPKRSIKSSLRKRKTSSNIPVYKKESQDVEYAVTSSFFPVEISNVEIKVENEEHEEVVENECQKEIVENFQEIPEVEILNLEENKDSDDDDDYQPVESSSDEESESDDNDEPIRKKNTKTAKSRKKIVDSDEEESFPQSASEPENSGLEEETESRNLKVVDGSDVILSLAEGNINTPAEAKYDYQCPDCKKIMLSRGALTGHTIKMHGYELKLSCPKCPDMKFSRRIDLVRHRKTVHGSICEKCGKRLYSQHSLVYHYKSKHNIQFTFTCPICKQKFDRRVDLRAHRKEHKLSAKEKAAIPERQPQTEEEAFWVANPCQECGSVFLSARKLEQHLLHTHELKIPLEERQAKRKKCYWCYRYFTLEQRHWIHRKLMHPEKIVEFPCEKCPEVVFNTTRELIEHFETNHVEDDTHTCHFCDWPFLSKPSLKTHLKGHVNKKPDPDVTDAAKLPVCRFNCWFCWELFPTQEKLDRHLKKSTRHRKPKWSAKPFAVEFPCEDFDCEQHKSPLASVEQLKMHLAEKHPNQEVITCERCSWSFLSQDFFNLHKLNHVPRRASRYKCPNCDYIASILPSLKDHWNICHGISLNMHECTHCQKRFSSRLGVAQHIAQAHGKLANLTETGTACDQCGKLLKDQKALQMHMRNKHTEAKCPECNLGFDSNAKLTSHRRKEHGYGGLLCPICGRVCFSRSNLRAHISSHTTGRKFICHLCGKRMMSFENLREHIKKVHENQEPNPRQKFVCQECGKAYARKDTLDDHIRVQHSNETHRVWSCDKCGMRFGRPGYLKDHQKAVNGCQERITIMDAESASTLQTANL